MNLGIQSIGSSSSGNSYIVTNGNTHLILDVGLSGKKIRSALAAAHIPEDAVQGILVTHEHVDHINSIRMMTRVLENSTVYSSRGTAYSCDKFEYVPENRRQYVASQDEWTVGDIAVKAFAISHDAAEPLGFTFRSGDTKLTVVTDTGIVTDEIFEEIRTSDILVLESNHEVSMLEMGPYPYSVKQRILSDHGHLSNVACGETLTRMLQERPSLDPMHKVPKILLAHLSSNNNTPFNASITVNDILEQNEFRKDEDFRMGIAAKSEVSGLITF